MSAAKQRVAKAYAMRIKAVRYARATCALEGMKQSATTKELTKRIVSGEITIDDAISQARAVYGMAS